MNTVDKNSASNQSALAENDQVTVRAYRADDLEACQLIAGSSTDYAHAVDENADAILVAEVNQRIVGFGFIQIWDWNKAAWLGELVVDQPWRGGGVGRRLLQCLEDEARERGCRVTMDHPPSNHPVVTFYLNNGYRICGYNDSFFSKEQGGTALFLCKDL